MMRTHLRIVVFTLSHRDHTHGRSRTGQRPAFDSRNRFRDKEPGWRSKKERGKKKRDLLALSPIRNAALPCLPRASTECARSVPRVCPKVSPPSLSLCLSPRTIPMCRRRSVKGGRRGARSSSQPGLAWTIAVGVLGSGHSSMLRFPFFLSSRLPPGNHQPDDVDVARQRGE